MKAIRIHVYFTKGHWLADVETETQGTFNELPLPHPVDTPPEDIKGRLQTINPDAVITLGKEQVTS